MQASKEHRSMSRQLVMKFMSQMHRPPRCRERKCCQNGCSRSTCRAIPDFSSSRDEGRRRRTGKLEKNISNMFTAICQKFHQKSKVSTLATREETVNVRHELSQSLVEGTHCQTLYKKKKTNLCVRKCIRNSAVAT